VILLDTSVLIDYLRTTDPRLLALMQQHGAAICGLTRADILYGALGPKRRQRILATLNTFAQLSSSFRGRPDAERSNCPIPRP